MAILQIRLDAEMKARAQNVATHMGLDLSTAVRLFLAQMVTENGLPFKPYADPFYSDRNQAALKSSIEQLRSGQTVIKTLEELESMAG